MSGFSERRWESEQKIKSCDYLISYVTGISCFIGILEVTCPPLKDRSPIWKDEDFLTRLKVKAVDVLQLETAVPSA